MRRALLVSIALIAVAACDSTATDPDAGIDGGTATVDAGERSDAGPIDCDGPVDESCPASLPYTTSRCAVGLMCTFDDPNGSWVYTCPDGRWESMSICDPTLPGACPVPRFSERCSTPFSGMLTGGSIEIGPVTTEPFRPFADAETVEFTVGGQGSAMILYRIRIEGIDAPDCIRAVTTLSSPIIERVSEPRTISLLCGSSLGILSVLQTASPCPDDPAVVTLTVDVAGIGMASASLTIPAMAFCPRRG